MPTATVKPSTNSITPLRLGGWSGGASAYDGARNDLSTGAHGWANASTSQKGNSTGTLVLSGVPALPAGTYTAKTLYVNWSITTVDDPDMLGPNLTISYSLNAGSSWSVFSGGMNLSSVGSGQLSLSLGAGQDVTQVQVKAVATVYGDQLGTCTFDCYIFDAFIDGIYTSQSSQGKKTAAISGF